MSIPRLPGLQQGPWRNSRNTAAAAAALSAIENILRGGSREQEVGNREQEFGNREQEVGSREQEVDTVTEALAGLMAGLGGGQVRDMGPQLGGPE